MNLEYEIKLRKLLPEEGGGWFAEIPLLPGCMADGETIEEAVKNLNEAKASWIETNLEINRAVPEPDSEVYSGQLRLRMPKSLHRDLSQKAKEENVSFNQFILYHLARGVGHKGKELT
ncbi:toxin-antitoxin system HicB family antitoxin [Desulfitispora alkaliphila]|uniref:toxin-antitoxin system HicB family antitoxin n=1 Tax=Desulfitispora alkaliphila TaxID=622674 RepID=UPI003D21F566